MRRGILQMCVMCSNGMYQSKVGIMETIFAGNKHGKMLCGAGAPRRTSCACIVVRVGECYRNSSL